jgi:hypothetical protein
MKWIPAKDVKKMHYHMECGRLVEDGILQKYGEFFWDGSRKIWMDAMQREVKESMLEILDESPSAVDVPIEERMEESQRLLAEEIYNRLNKFGAGLGNASILIIQSALAGANSTRQQPDEKKHFRVLKYGWMYVDVNRLAAGLYQTMTPVLYDKDYTKDKIMQSHKDCQPYTGETDVHLQFVKDNLNKEGCRMVDVYLCESPASLQPGIVEQLRKMNPFRSAYKVAWDQCCDTLARIIEGEKIARDKELQQVTNDMNTLAKMESETLGWLVESKKEIEILKTALNRAVELIRRWHDAYDRKSDKETLNAIWEVYYGKSDEMKLIREALAGEGDKAKEGES